MHSSIKTGMNVARLLPISAWLKSYRREDLHGDVFAGVITAIILVPQAIAYAMLAGLPPQLGLYASIFPPIVYALLGTSRTLSVGPVSIAAIMIASALSSPQVAALGAPSANAVILSAECGLILLLMAVFRMGGLVNFISHPVLTGFTSGASILIVLSQLPKLAGLSKPKCGLDADCYGPYLQLVNTAEVAIGAGSLAVLIFFAKPLAAFLKRAKLAEPWTTAISKCGPLLTVILATAAVALLDLESRSGIKVVGQIPSGLPGLNLEFIAPDKWAALLPYSAFIALIAFVESVAIAKLTAKLRHQKIDSNQELIALGASNIASSLSGGMNVAGGFSRTMVNYAAGARTQIAMLIAVATVSLALIFFTESFKSIPEAALAAIILAAIVPLIRLRNIATTWHYNRSDGIAQLATLIGVLALGIEEGLALGIGLTIVSYLRKTSLPHIAVVGRIPHTEHYRNVKRYEVETWRNLLLLRVDENITFANVGYIEEFVQSELAGKKEARHVVLILASVSYIDATALEALELMIEHLRASGIVLHLAEAKGPVMDQLEKTDFLARLLPGKAFFHTADAVRELA
ncbi:MAG: SulP family inorganic anion transporter [Gammaproteobacteria bacterium]